MCVAGIATGIAAALMLGQVLAGLLFGVTPYDLPTLSATAVALLVVAALAWVPCPPRDAHQPDVGAARAVKGGPAVTD